MPETATRLGRPTKFTEETRKKILWALRLGNYRKTAAEYACISERTLGDWLYKGSEENGGEYADFHNDVLEAEQAAEVRALGVIQQAANNGQWKAAAWFLERKFPERYCTRAAIFLAKRLDVNDPMDLDELSDDDLHDEVLRQIASIARSLPRDKLIAAIDGEEPAPRVIDVPSGNGSVHNRVHTHRE